MKVLIRVVISLIIVVGFMSSFYLLSFVVKVLWFGFSVIGNRCGVFGVSFFGCL